MTRALRVIPMLLFLAAAPVARSADSTVLKAEAERVAVIKRTKQSVVAVFGSEGEGGGSGVVISPDGYALTNFHVARPCGDALKCGLPDGRVHDAVIVGIDPVGDIALIKLFGRNDFPAAVWGDSDRTAVGDWAFVMGNPFLLAADFQPTVTYGVISGVHRYQPPSGTLLEYADCLQTDASINPGNSGGPLFDAEGKLIGIVGRASFEKRGRVNVGTGYAISINQVKNFLGHLRSGRIVDHATLGATVGFDSEGRVVVTDILKSSDAYRRGLRYDDELVALAGRPLETPNGLTNALGILPKGWRVPLSYRRDGERFDVLVRLAGVHAEGELIEKLANSSANPMPMPKPRPRHGEKPEEHPRLETPTPKETEKKKEMPEVVARHFDKREGYANYYFNRLQRDRVLNAWTDSPGSDAPWNLTGVTGSGSAFGLTLSDEGVALELPNASFDWTATDDLTESLAPEGSGGMLPALHLWRRLALSKPEQFGQVYYHGTAPFPNHPELADVIVAIRGGLESHFFFSPDDGRLLGIEMWSDSVSDPCEIRFSEYRQTGRDAAAGRIEVYFGDEPFAELMVEPSP